MNGGASGVQLLKLPNINQVKPQQKIFIPTDEKLLQQTKTVFMGEHGTIIKTHEVITDDYVLTQYYLPNDDNIICKTMQKKVEDDFYIDPAFVNNNSIFDT
jgi:hypothetical protein